MFSLAFLTGSNTISFFCRENDGDCLDDCFSSCENIVWISFKTMSGKSPPPRLPVSSLYYLLGLHSSAGRALQRERRGNGLDPRKTFFRAISQLLKLQFTAMVTYSFHLLFLGSYSSNINFTCSDNGYTTRYL